MERCPSCGLEVKPGSSFCNHCGIALNAQGQTQSVAAGPAAVAAAARPATSHAAPEDYQERVLWEEYPSMRTALPPIILLLLIGGAIIAVIHLVAPLDPMISWIITALIGLIVLGILVRYFIRLRSTKYRLSTQRIFVQRGLFNVRTDEVELEKYKDVFVKQDLLDRLVGCGDVEVITSDVTHQSINIIDVCDPVRKKELIRQAARDRKVALGVWRREDL